MKPQTVKDLRRKKCQFRYFIDLQLPNTRFILWGICPCRSQVCDTTHPTGLLTLRGFILKTGREAHGACHAVYSNDLHIIGPVSLVADRESHIKKDDNVLSMDHHNGQCPAASGEHWSKDGDPEWARHYGRAPFSGGLPSRPILNLCPRRRTGARRGAGASAYRIGTRAQIEDCSTCHHHFRHVPRLSFKRSRVKL